MINIAHGIDPTPRDERENRRNTAQGDIEQQAADLANDDPFFIEKPDQ